MNNPAPAAGNSAGSLLADPTGTITTVHFIIIAIVAVLVVLALIYGARLKHRRRVAERQVQEHAIETERAGGTAVDETPDAAPVALQPAPEPAAVAEPAPRPVEQAVPMPVEQAPADAGPAAGPVTQIKGLGPKVAARLGELGITTVGQIAALDEDGAEALDARLGPFAGRLARDRWVEQARFLAAGDRAGFEAVFGRL